MEFGFGDGDEAFRQEVRSWLEEHLVGRFTAAVGRGGPGSEHEGGAERRAWERELGEGGWIGLGWSESGYGNRVASLTRQVVWAEEYARVRAPGRYGHIGENLLAPTLLAYGTEEQRRRYLPPIARGEELWCQGYSEPGAGSDLASLRTTAVRDADGRWRVTGQKVWTSLAHEADRCFVLARTEPGSRRHHGLSFLLVPMDQPGLIDVRPIRQLTGTSEFNEVFFEGALAEDLVGEEGGGWRVAMGLLGFERGVSTLAQQIGFAEELREVTRTAVKSGAVGDPVIADRLVRLWAELRTMRWHALRTLGGADDAGAAGAPSVAKLLWGGWHQRLGELALRVRGPAAAVGPADWSPDQPYELDAQQRLFLFTRADTIYGGSDEIQRNIIAERVLGLPREEAGRG
ncbi:acyl-CoA dehydrogenase family protein [Streptomyces sp. NPDC050145]|uniref:acyl-CoA dehydrogenase family protein n=1 Tax=Streptomyces sp. NPDC050145 TaxID=3365602 RepID=UPI0037AB28A6